MVSSRSVPTSSSDPGVRETRSPESTGMAPVRDATARWAVATASARVSRSQRNFTRASYEDSLLDLRVVVVGPVNWGWHVVCAGQGADRDPRVLHRRPQGDGAVMRSLVVLPNSVPLCPQDSTALSTAPEAGSVNKPIKNAACLGVRGRDPQSILPHFADVNRRAPFSSTGEFNISALDAAVPFHAIVVAPTPPRSNVVLLTGKRNPNCKTIGVEPEVPPE